MLSSLEDYYLGGIIEITEEIRRCGFYFNKWFQESIPRDPWLLCAPFIGVKNRNGVIPFVEEPTLSDFNLLPQVLTHGIKALRNNNEHLSVYSLHSRSLFGHSLAIGKFLGQHKGEVVAVSSPFESKGRADELQSETGAIYLIKLSELALQLKGKPKELKFDKIEFQQSKNIQEPPMDYIYPFGSHLITIRLLGEDILAVSHPGQSTIKFYFSGQVLFEIYWDDASTIYGTSGLKLVGETMTSGDIDGDGTDDLLIGAPKCDHLDIPQRGQVFIVNGKILEKTLEFVFRDKQTRLDWHAPRIPAQEVINFTIFCPSSQKHGYDQFGSQITIGSIADSITGISSTYILIGSGGLSEIYIYNSAGSFEVPVKVLLLKERNTEKSGDSLLLATRNGWIFTGDSIGHLEDHCVQCGKVYAIQMLLANRSFELRLGLILESSQGIKNKGFERFGFRGTLGKTKLYISSPFSGNGKGRLWAVRLQHIFQHSRLIPGVSTGNRFSLNANKLLETPHIRLRPLVNGLNRNSNFGKVITTFDDAEDSYFNYLVVSEPQYGSQKLTMASKQLVGNINIYKVKNYS